MGNALASFDGGSTSDTASPLTEILRASQR